MSQPAVIARELTLKGDEGTVFGPLNFDIPSMGLTNLTGSGGSGRTALALVLTGRMKPTSGALEVLGETKTGRIQRRVALAGVEQIDMLERSVTVRDVLTETLSWRKPWYAPLRPATEADLEELCTDIYGARDLPPLDAYISQLPNLDKLLLRICMSLHPAHGNQIDLLVMDDLEQVHEQTDRLILLEVLQRLSSDIPVVVNSVNPIDHPFSPQCIIELDTNAGHAIPEHDGYSDPTPVATEKEEF